MFFLWKKVNWGLNRNTGLHGCCAAGPEQICFVNSFDKQYVELLEILKYFMNKA